MSTDSIAIALERMNNSIDDIKDTVSDIRVTQASLVESVKYLQRDKDRMEEDIKHIMEDHNATGSPVLISFKRTFEQHKEVVTDDIKKLKDDVKDIKDIPKNTLVTFLKGSLAAIGSLTAGWLIAKGTH